VMAFRAWFARAAVSAISSVARLLLEQKEPAHS